MYLGILGFGWMIILIKYFFFGYVCFEVFEVIDIGLVFIGVFIFVLLIW